MTQALLTDSSYLSVTDILATQEKVLCQFDLPVYKLGFLDSSGGNEHIMAGTKLELPFWLAQPLSVRRRKIVTSELPKIYRSNFREILQADASVVDLHKTGPHYYTFGSYLLMLNFSENEEVSECLIQTFKNRFHYIMDASQNSDKSDSSQILDKLDEFERVMFLAGQQCMKNQLNWQNRRIDKIAVSNLVLNQKKRKRSD